MRTQGIFINKADGRHEMNKGLMLFLIFLFFSISPKLGFALEVETHEAINDYITKNRLSGFSINEYLNKNLGFIHGRDEMIKGQNNAQEAYKWIINGGRYEDKPPYFVPYVRSANHFHNPLAPSLNKAGFTGIWGAHVLSGDSAVLWAQKNKGVQCSFFRMGCFSWYDVRDYYYSALTSKNKDERNAYFAEIFRGIGQLMHLVQDMSVPEHTRNEGHYTSYMYENWVLETQNTSPLIDPKRRVIFDTALANPLFIDTPSLSQPSAFGAAAPIPIANLFDTDRYKGSNPSDTLSNNVGLSEYTNANFFSKDTIFKNFVHPMRENTNYSSFGLLPITTVTTVNGVQLNTFYIEGYGKKHLAGLKYFAQEIEGMNGRYNLKFILDDRCYADYATQLLPRAVGYSAGLLNYFFRGDIRLEYTTSPNPGYVIVNKTDEDMSGLFQILYDNNKDQRVKYMDGNFTLGKQARGDVFDITAPADAKEPGKYILAFKGNMGNEKGAVAGYVTSRLLEITPPDQFIYSMINDIGNDPYFRSIRAKVKNASPSEQMKNGTIQAVAKYKSDTYDANFIYSMSDPQAIDLSSNAAVEVAFNFDNDPIPVDVTDLYLEVIFKGTIGNEANATASGVKDISEPTPIDVFNDTEKSCISGSWYSTADAIDLMDTSSPKDHIADTWDVNPHIVKNIYVKISSMANPQKASPAVYNAVVPSLNPGEFHRVIYILTDEYYKYSFYSTWSPSPGHFDRWLHGDKEHSYNGTAVKNQTDYSSDPVVCGRDPWCYIYHYSAYYSLGNYQMWWGGGVVYINQPYPADSTCKGY